MKLRIGVAVGLVVLAAATAVGVIVMRGSGGGGASSAAPVISALATPGPPLGNGLPADPTTPATGKGGRRCGALWNATMTLGGHDGGGRSIYRQGLAGLKRGDPAVLVVAVRPYRGWCRVLVQMSDAIPPPAVTKALDCEITRDTFGCGEIRPLPSLGRPEWIWFELNADGSLS